VAWEEINQAKVKSTARWCFPPTGIPRHEVLEKVGEELGLGSFDDRKNKDFLTIDYLDKQIQKMV